MRNPALFYDGVDVLQENDNYGVVDSPIDAVTQKLPKGEAHFEVYEHPQHNNDNIIAAGMVLPREWPEADGYILVRDEDASTEEESAFAVMHLKSDAYKDINGWIDPDDVYTLCYGYENSVQHTDSVSVEDPEFMEKSQHRRADLYSDLLEMVESNELDETYDESRFGEIEHVPLDPDDRVREILFPDQAEEYAPDPV